MFGLRYFYLGLYFDSNTFEQNVGCPMQTAGAIHIECSDMNEFEEGGEFFDQFLSITAANDEEFISNMKGKPV